MYSISEIASINTRWTTEKKEYIRDLFSRGLSAAKVSISLNKKFGTAFSRNSIIGISHRAGLRSAGKKQSNGHKDYHTAKKINNSIIQNRLMAIEQRKEKKKYKLPINNPIFKEIRGGEKILLDIEKNDCVFPIETPTGNIVFCAREKETTSSYCAEHAEICFEQQNIEMGNEQQGNKTNHT